MRHRRRALAPASLRVALAVALVAATLATNLLRPEGAQAAGIAVASTSSGQSSARTSITLGRPSGTEAGHVMVASVASNGDADSFTAPEGWSLVREDTVGTAIRQAIYVRTATSSEPASYTWTLADWRRIAGGITTYAGVDAANPVDSHGALQEPAAGSEVTSPSIDTTVAGTLLVHFAAINAEGTLTPPQGMTERWEAISPNLTNSRDVLVSSSDAQHPSAGPTGTRTTTASLPGPSIGVILALRPSEVPPPPDDTTPPETTIDSGPTGTVSSDTATFTFSSNEAGSTFQCRLDTGTFQSCSSPHTYTGLSDGPHEFAVAAVDPAENIDATPATRGWTVAVPTSSIAAVGSASSESSSSRTSVTVNRPPGTQAGHVMVAAVAVNGDVATITAPAGWTLIRNDVVGTAVRQAIYFRVATSSEPGSYTWTLSAWRRAAAGITTYSGVSTSSPVDAHGALTTGRASTAVTAPSLLVASSNARLLHLAAVKVDGTITPPTGMTERFEANSPNPSNSRDVLAALADAPLGDSGATGTRTATVDPAGPSIAGAVALRPAGPPPPPDTTPPDTFIDSGPSGTVDSAFATFTFSSNESGSTFRCRLDAGSFEACSSPKSYSGLANGSHTFEVAAVDPANNVDPTPASRTWTVALGTAAVLVGAGDIASCSNNNDEATAQLLDMVVAAQPQARVFTAGDNVYDSGTSAEFDNCYHPTWGRHKARTSPAVGNHEYNTPGASGYYGYFGAAAGDPAKGYYDYSLGDWHVVVLNSQCGAVGGCHAGSAQEQWLRARLAAVAADCTVAIWHHPLFSSGSTHGSNLAFQPFWQALYDHGADLVVNGHDHIYERFAPQTATGVADALFGVRQITSGLGGRSRYSIGTIEPNSEFRYTADYGVLKLTLHADRYDWQQLRVNGATVIDSGTSDCHDAPGAEPPPPPVPGPITAVGSSSSGSSTAQPALTIARPPNLQAGQVMVANIVSNDDDPGFSAPPGWTLVRDHNITGALRQAVYYRVAGSSEPGSYTWALTANTVRRITGGITAYSGVDTADPLDGHAASVQTSASTAVPAPSITTTVANARLLHLAAVNAEGAISPPEGMTERWEAASPNPRNSRDALAAMADIGLGAAGATGVRTATASQAGPNIGVALALRPAGDGGG